MQVAECDVLVSYLPHASMGSAIEIYMADKAGIPVYTVGSMRENWVIRSYSLQNFDTIDDLAAHLKGVYAS